MNDPKMGLNATEGDNFEEQLGRALLHVDPPGGFSARVLERTTPSVPSLALWSRFPTWQRSVWGVAWAIAAIVPAFSAMLAWQAHIRRERTLIQAQFETALRITDRALDDTRAQLARAGLNLGQ